MLRDKYDWLCVQEEFEKYSFSFYLLLIIDDLCLYIYVYYRYTQDTYKNDKVVW